MGEQRGTEQLPIEVCGWRVKYAGPRKFGLSVAENTCAWIVGICPRDTMDVADP
jgi:hypothetical protein